MKTPQLSIIIPVFNAPQSLRSLCTLILSQPYTDLELILVDDGSTDHTLNLLRGIQSKDNRVVVLSKKNGGPSSARNLGLARARGVFCMFFDADDSLSKHMISTMMNYGLQGSTDLVVCGWSVDMQKGDSLQRGVTQIVPKKETIAGSQGTIKKFALKSIGDNGIFYNLWNKLFRLEIIRRHTLTFQENIRFGEDLIFILQYLGKVKSIQLIDKPLYHYLSNSATSVFSASALSVEYRIVNYQALEQFAGDASDQETADLLQWIKWRWLLSYSMIISQSSLSSQEKLQRLRVIGNEPIRASKKSPYLSNRKLGIEQLLAASKRSPKRLLFIGSAAATLKKLI